MIPSLFPGTGSWAESISASNGTENDAPASSRRSRLIRESRDHNRREYKGPRNATWTKQPKYAGYMLTFDLNKDMEPLPFSAGPKGQPPKASFPNGSDCSETHYCCGRGDTCNADQIADPMMLELDGITPNSHVIILAES
jgi:hypothetical protein